MFRHVADCYPGAPIYTSLFDPAIMRELVDPARVRPSYLNRLPNASAYFRFLAPLYPAAFERFDLSAYDLVVSTTTAWAKGVRVRENAVHVCYIHTVSRFAFDYERYVGGFGWRGRLAKPLIEPLVRWDRAAAMRPTAFIANSRNVAERVKRYYGRDAFVVPCPVDVDRFAIGTSTGDYLLVVSRLLGYKRVDLAIAAARLTGARLLIVGSGPAEAELKATAVGSRTEFLGSISDAELRDVMGAARAVVLPGEEDYGLVPLEANAAGRPAIAFGRGGALETIRPGITGEHFPEQTPESLATAIRAFDPARYDPVVLRAHAESFGPEPFKRAFAQLVDDIAVRGRPPESV